MTIITYLASRARQKRIGFFAAGRMAKGIRTGRVHRMPSARHGAGVLLILLYGFFSATAYAGDQIQIPVRWCALDGSPAVDSVATAPVNPYNGNPEPDTDAILWRRHERASDNIMIPGGDVTFRSGFTAAVRTGANFPILPDPCPPVGTNVCQSGSAMGLLCTPDAGNEDAAVCGAGVTCAATTTCPAACTSGCVGDLGDIAGTGSFCNGGTNANAGCSSDASCPGGTCDRDLAEYNLSVAACTRAWDQIAEDFDTPLLGPVAVNVGQFRDPNGALDGLKGRATGSTIVADDICAMPPSNVTSATGGAIVARDNQNLVAFEQTNERMVAHELGHDLYLWHGDGIDNDGDGAFDQVCDGAESTCATPRTFMSSTGCGALTTNMTSDQRDVARAVGAVYTGSTMDPPGVLIPSPAIGDQKGDSIYELKDSTIDLKSIGVIHNTARKTTDILINLLGPIPRATPDTRIYAVALDLDNNRKTGTKVGPATAIQSMKQTESAGGFEIMFVVAVSEGLELRNQVFRAVEGEFELCEREPACRRVTSRLVPILSGDDEDDKGFEAPPEIDAHSVVLQVPTELIGNGRAIGVLGIATFNQQFDFAPDNPERLLTLRPVPPEFPVCFVEPLKVRPGDVATFNATKLQSNAMVKIILGDRELGGGTTSDDGSFSGEFQIPFETRAGARLVTIGVAGQAMSADCPLEVENDPRPQSRYEYATKIVCGLQGDPEQRHLIAGVYASTVNVHNPNQKAASVFMKYAMAYPDRKIVPIGWDRLAYDQAMAHTCNELNKRLGNDELTDGFLVLQSDVPLDVTAVITSGSVDSRGRFQKHESVDVEQIEGRRIRVFEPDLVVESIDPISVDCRGRQCQTSARIRIKNAGMGNAGPFTTRVTLDPQGSQSVEQPSTGLTSGSSVEIEVTSPPGGNCFDPDCTVCAIVDSDEVVAEANEDNNEMCVTRPG